MVANQPDSLINFLGQAMAARADLIDPGHKGALRLFNGFYEGNPGLVVDLYATTQVLYSYLESPEESHALLQIAQDYGLQSLPWIECIVQKIRNSEKPAERRGSITYGRVPAEKIQENGVWYGINLLINQDTGFYLDTCHLRQWLRENSSGRSVLNLFAYTGSLGVAALAGNASHVIQVDKNEKVLQFALRSCSLNQLDQDNMTLVTDDFFRAVAHYKHAGELFDLVIVDPPFFSKTPMGVIDLVNESQQVINKIRPLVKDNGFIIAINNALFLSGTDYWLSLNNLCQDGYLSIEGTIPVPSDVTGFSQTIQTPPPVDPTPFNHPTKIAILRVKRKASKV